MRFHQTVWYGHSLNKWRNPILIIPSTPLSSPSPIQSQLPTTKILWNVPLPIHAIFSLQLIQILPFLRWGLHTVIVRRSLHFKCSVWKGILAFGILLWSSYASVSRKVLPFLSMTIFVNTCVYWLRIEGFRCFHVLRE